MSRQGARKHIGVLAEAELIFLENRGRDTLISLDLKRLHQAKEFIADLEANWDKRLDALKNFVEKK